MPQPNASEPKPIQGARVPLFDRLIDHEPGIRKDARPLRVYERRDLLASVARDLHRLLNCRCPSFAAMDAAKATVLSYGIPDFSAMCAASVSDRRLLAETLRAAITAFEPRLLNVTIQFTAGQEPQNILSGSIHAQLRIGRMLEPVTFPVLLHGDRGEIEILAVPDNHLGKEEKEELDG